MLIEDLKLFDKGHRALIYTGFWRGKKVAIKRSKKTAAGNTVKNEVNWLKILNKYKIGPKLIYAEDDFMVYKFVEGVFLPGYLKVKKSRKVLKDVMSQCRKLDKLKVNKEEMTNPYKHILVDKKGKAVMIDFERCRKTEKPQNVTQFCQYLTSNAFKKIYDLKINKKELISLLKDYKKDMSEKNYRKILKGVFKSK